MTATGSATIGCSTSTATGWRTARCAGRSAYVDTDGDGRWDIKLTDRNNDGKADAANDL